MKSKKVTKREFDEFINSYPNKLEIDVSGIFEPPIKSWNDFKLGKWPDSVIGFCKLYDGSDYYNGKNCEYYLCKTG